MPRVREYCKTYHIVVKSLCARSRKSTARYVRCRAVQGSVFIEMPGRSRSSCQTPPTSTLDRHLFEWPRGRLIREAAFRTATLECPSCQGRISKDRRDQRATVVFQCAGVIRAHREFIDPQKATFRSVHDMEADPCKALETPTDPTSTIHKATSYMRIFT